MKFSIATIAAFASLVVAAPAAEPVAENELVARNGPLTFIVATSGANCGKGTTISASSATAKGNFSPAQKNIIITQGESNCHISLYTGPNQSGTVDWRIPADDTNECFTTSNSWLSWGYYCP